MADDFEYFSRLSRGECGGALQTERAAAGARSPPPTHLADTAQQRRALSARQHRSQDEKSNAASRDARLLSRQRTRSVTGGGGAAGGGGATGGGGGGQLSTSGETDGDYLTVRHFQTYGKDVQNKGDSLKAAHSSSSLNRLGARDDSGDEDDDDDVGGARPAVPAAAAVHSHRTSASSDRSSSVDDGSTVHRILLLGGSGVGKTSLTQQFLTSKDVKDDDIDDDGAEKFVTVLLDGKESTVIFMDSDYDKNSYDPSSATAYIVVYSVTDRESLAEAQALLKNLRHFEKDKAIILVGNKIDLARKRQVAVEDGERVAMDYGADFIETSTVLNHKVDNLLVGILSKIRQQSTSQAPARKAKDLRKSIKGLLGRIVSK